LATRRTERAPSLESAAWISHALYEDRVAARVSALTTAAGETSKRRDECATSHDTSTPNGPNVQ